MTPADEFQPVGVGQTLMFKIESGEFIQILYCHWLTVSTIGAQHPAEVFVYYSLCLHVSTNVKQQITALLTMPSSEIRKK